MASQSPKLVSCSSVSPKLLLSCVSFNHPLSRKQPLSISRPLANGISLRPLLPRRICGPLTSASAFRGNKNNGHNGNNNIGGGGGGDGGEGGRSDANRDVALVVLARAGRELESLPADLAAAVDGCHVTGEAMQRFLEMEGSPLLCWLLLRWLLQLEPLLAGDLFLAKFVLACGVISKVGTGATNGLVIAMKAVVKELDDKVVEIPAVSTPDKVEENWWSCFEAGAELSAGLVRTESSMRGGPYQPAAMTKVSASFSRGRTGKNGKA